MVEAREMTADAAPPCIVISGASGLVGRPLVAALEQRYRVIRLVRPGSRSGGGPATRSWDPKAAQYDPQTFAEADAVIHLAGENIASGRWTAARKGRIFDSRVDTTRRMAEALACMARPPKAMIVASAVGYYGDRGDQELTESDGPGEGFLSHVCQHWEAASSAAAEAGIQTMALRFGMILAPEGGALDKMLGPFKWGLGGRLGSGRQFMSWIHLHDVVAAVEFLLHRGLQRNETAKGAYNLVSPQALRNADFVEVLGRVLGRPTVLPAPAFALRLALGEMADELLLSSTRAVPSRLTEAGFTFRYGTLDAALKHIVNGTK